MSVRAKFKVQALLDSTDKDGNIYSRQVTLVPVYSSDPNHENRSFWQATPSGSVVLWINNPAAFAQFEQDAEYYLDFSRAAE